MYNVGVMVTPYYNFENRSKAAIIAAAAIMLLTLPWFQDLIPHPFLYSAGVILLLIIVAGITPKSTTFVIAGIGFAVAFVLTAFFEYQSVTTYPGKHFSLFFVNQILAACFAVALYFYVRSLVGIFVERFGIRVEEAAESDGGKDETLKSQLLRPFSENNSHDIEDFQHLELSLVTLQKKVEESIARQNEALEEFMLAELDLKEEQRIANNQLSAELEDIRGRLQQLRTNKRVRVKRVKRKVTGLAVS